jgi:hypothetical protein
MGKVRAFDLMLRCIDFRAILNTQFCSEPRFSCLVAKGLFDAHKRFIRQSGDEVA